MTPFHPPHQHNSLFHHAHKHTLGIQMDTLFARNFHSVMITCYLRVQYLPYLPYHPYHHMLSSQCNQWRNDTFQWNHRYLRILHDFVD
jgi:hypothetical protein